MRAFFKGAGYFFTGLRWLIHPKLRRFVIVPLLVNSVVFAAVISLGASEFNILINNLLAHLPTWLEWLRWLLWPLFALTALVLCFYTFTLVANLIASPFNGLLAERVEQLLVPSQSPPPGKPLWKELATAPVNEIKKLSYFILWALPLLILFFIPALNAAAPFVWFAFSAWMLALQYLDYPMGNHGLSFPAQRRALRKQPMLALGFGCAVLLITLIPVINFLAMPAAVVGATLMWVDTKGCDGGHAAR